MQQTDKYKLIDDMVVEVAAHEEREHWNMVPRSSLPLGAKTSDPFGCSGETVSQIV